MKILLVEDEKMVAEAVVPHLQKNNYTVTVAPDFEKAKAVAISNFDLVLLDWALPDGMGIDLLKLWRLQGHAVPVIMLTARADITDKVLGLELGAHDYVTKPFDFRELLARIRVQLRQESAPAEILLPGNLKISLALRKVFLNSLDIQLTRKEFDLLVFLAQSGNQVFTREELLNRIWGFENFPTTRTVDTHVLQLRNKLGAAIIETVHGIGYRVKV